MINLIPASKAHLPQIKRIAHETWPATFGAILSEKQIAYMLDWMYSIPSLTNQIVEKGHVFILAQEGDEYLGYISYELNYNGLSKTKVHKIYLLPASQGKGVGALLIDWVEKIAIENENKALLLNVNRYNKAVGFYKKMGFNIVGNENIDIGDGFLMEDFIMEKPL